MSYTWVYTYYYNMFYTCFTYAFFSNKWPFNPPLLPGASWIGEGAFSDGLRSVPVDLQPGALGDFPSNSQLCPNHSRHAIARQLDAVGRSCTKKL